MRYTDWEYEQEGISEYTSCKHAYGVPEYRSYGSNIPDNCQGCVFPGDEAHIACDITHDECEENYCPFGPGFWCRRAAYTSTEEAARALFGKTA